MSQTRENKTPKGGRLPDPKCPKGIWGCPIAPIPAEVAAFRAEFRARRAPTPLVGWRHASFILLLGASVTTLVAFMVRAPVWWEWLALPVGFLIANLTEWAAHRWPMHHPMAPLRVMYEKHTLEHHRFYTEASMEAEAAGDFDSVLFSLPSLAFFLGGIGAPIAGLFFLLVSRNAGWLFTALAVDYYVLYECFHLAYHLPERSWVGRLPGMAFLRRHHTRHHDRTLMADWNFNVTFPLSDALFGTRFVPPAR
jgi:hypothetical protein